MSGYRGYLASYLERSQTLARQGLTVSETARTPKKRAFDLHTGR